MMNRLSDEKLNELISKGKDPIKYFIEINKFLADMSHIAKSNEIAWVITKETALEIIKLYGRINK